MKIFIYSHAFAPQIGGIETVVLSLAQGLARRTILEDTPEFDVTVATQTARGHFDEATIPFRIIRRPGFGTLCRLTRQADVVHLAGPALLPLLIAWLARKPTVIEHHGFQTICPNGQLLIEALEAQCPGHYMAGRHKECLRCNSGQGWFASFRLWLLTFIRRFLASRASVNIAPTSWVAGMLQLPRTTHIPHGIAAPELHAPFNRLGPTVIAFQGRLVATKGVKLLLQAAENLHSQNRAFRLLIIGDGPDRTKLEHTLRQYALAEWVQFLGRVPEEQLGVTLKQASLIVIPSLAGEVFGLVVLESMARSLPVIASDIGAFVEVLGDAGITFRTGDATDLACKIAELLDAPDLCARLAHRARQRAIDLYNLEDMIDAHARLYRTLAALPRKPHLPMSSRQFSDEGHPVDKDVTCEASTQRPISSKGVQ